MSDQKQALDSLPEDLEASFSSLDYEIPNNDRRRIAGFLYLVVGVVALDSVYFPRVRHLQIPGLCMQE